jgi:hypothetical protein
MYIFFNGNMVFDELDNELLFNLLKLLHDIHLLHALIADILDLTVVPSLIFVSIVLIFEARARRVQDFWTRTR